MNIPYELRKTPYSKEEIMAVSKGGWVSGVISVPLNIIINREYGLFSDMLSEYLTGTDKLMDVKYELVGCEGNNLHLKVDGNAEGIINR